MGVTEAPHMLFGLSDLLTTRWISRFSTLTSPFTQDESVRELWNDRASGPNGFNGLFLEKCWSSLSLTSSNFVKTPLKELIYSTSTPPSPCCLRKTLHHYKDAKDNLLVSLKKYMNTEY